MLEGVELAAHGGIVGLAGATHVDHDASVEILDAGIDVGNEVIHPLVLQAHGIEHATGSLHHAWIGIALAGV